MSQPANPLHKELSPAEKQARKLADRAAKKKDSVYKNRKNRFGNYYVDLTMEKHEQEQRDRERERLKLLKEGIPKRSKELRLRQCEQVIALQCVFSFRRQETKHAQHLFMNTAGTDGVGLLRSADHLQYMVGQARENT